MVSFAPLIAGIESTEVTRTMSASLITVKHLSAALRGAVYVADVRPIVLRIGVLRHPARRIWSQRVRQT